MEGGGENSKVFSSFTLHVCFSFSLDLDFQKTETVLPPPPPPPSPAKTTFKATAAALTRPPPVSLTAGNKSFPWQLHGWLPPNKNTTLGALGRAVGAVSNSTAPLNATRALAKGLALHKQKPAALLKGQSGIVTYASSVAGSSSLAASDLRCFVDPATGQLVGLEQAGSVACSTASDVVAVPTATSAAGTYISQIKLAYTYDGAFVGRLVFYLKANATARESVAYTCGSAGGKAVDLLPNGDDFAVTKLNVGCARCRRSTGGSAGADAGFEPPSRRGRGSACRPGTLAPSPRRWPCYPWTPRECR
jgi:hypothetical protein